MFNVNTKCVPKCALILANTVLYAILFYFKDLLDFCMTDGESQESMRLDIFDVHSQ